jgi:DNA-directed RNA polymerase specialized sigma24 family protein
LFKQLFSVKHPHTKYQLSICENFEGFAHQDFVYHLASAFLCDADEADDAAQETFLQAELHINQYQCGSSLKSWIGAIAINVCRVRYRRQKACQRLELYLAGMIQSLQ